MVAINRYQLIAYAQKYKQIFTVKNCVLMSAGVWLTGGIFMLPTLTGWSHIDYNYGSNGCSYARDASSSYHYFILNCGFLLPLIVISICYLKLYLVVRASRKRVNAGPEIIDNFNQNLAASSTAQQHITKKRQELKLSKTLFVIFISFVSCWTPYFLVNILDPDRSRFPVLVHRIVSWITFMNSTMNPILYAFMNRQFREGYITILAGKCACTKKYLTENLQETLVVQVTSFNSQRTQGH